MLKVWHGADLHLGTAFGSLSNEKAKILRDEENNVLSRFMEVGLQHKADLILLAGDIFDSAEPSEELIRLARHAFTSVGCPIVIAPGNHDYYTENGFWKTAEWPENVHVFSSETPSSFYFPDLNVRVYGYAFESGRMEDSPMRHFSPDADDTLKLACFHADAGLQTSRYAPISSRELEDLPVVYAALGHIHMPPPMSVNIHGRGWAYSGSMMGHSPDEPGRTGGCLVTIDTEGKGKILSSQKIAVSKFHYETETVSVENCRYMSEVMERVRLCLENGRLDTSALVTLELIGETEPDLWLDRQMIVSMDHSCFDLRVRNRTVLRKERTDLENDNSVRGAFYRLLKEQLDSTDEKKRQVALEALQLGLKALDSSGTRKKRS